jgi:hypothetical protein
MIEKVIFALEWGLRVMFVVYSVIDLKSAWLLGMAACLCELLQEKVPNSL